MDSLATWDLRVAFALTWWLLRPGHSDSDHAECGGVSITDSVLVFVEINIGAMRISSFLGLNSGPFHRSG